MTLRLHSNAEVLTTPGVDIRGLYVVEGAQDVVLAWFHDGGRHREEHFGKAAPALLAFQTLAFSNQGFQTFAASNQSFPRTRRGRGSSPR